MSMAKAYAYTLPDGTPVLLSALKPSDYRILNQWVQSEYLKNISEATVGLSSFEKQELRLAAMDRVAGMTFQFGLGHDILMGSGDGLARLTYQLIQNPTMSFDEYYRLLFPELFLTSQGLDVINEMLELVYQEEIAAVAGSPDTANENAFLETQDSGDAKEPESPEPTSE